MQELPTAKEVFRALGGIDAVAKLTRSNYDTVCYWSATGKFPSKMYCVMKDELDALGLTAPRSLWKMVTKAKPRRRTIKKEAIPQIDLVVT
jgi:hypothetical protein